MRKTLNGKFLYSLFLISLFNYSCKQNPDSPKIILNSDNKCYHAVNNILNLIEKSVNSEKGNIDLMHSTNFFNLFVDAIYARNETTENKNSIDECLSKLFAKEKNENILKILKEISDKINKEKIDSKFLLMRNSGGNQKNFEKLGCTFKSNGIEYALCILNGDRSIILFSNNFSQNKICIDQNGNEFDQKALLKVSTEYPKLKCGIIPILDLKLKENADFAHLGGYLGKDRLGLSFLLSLIHAKMVLEKEKKLKNNNSKTSASGVSSPAPKKKENNIFLYNSGEDFSLSKDSSKNVDAEVLWQERECKSFYLDFFESFIKNTNIFEKNIGNFIEIDEQNFIAFAKNLCQGKVDAGGVFSPKKCLNEIIKMKKVGACKSLTEDFIYDFCQKHVGNKKEIEALLKKNQELYSKIKTFDTKKASDAEKKTYREILSEMKKNNEGIKELFQLSIPANKILNIAYVTFSDDNKNNDNTLRSSDATGKENFVFSCYNNELEDETIFFLNDKNELIQEKSGIVT